MISHDQPTIFGDKVIVAVSSVHDGPMNFNNNDYETVRSNRQAFFEAAGIDPLQVTLLYVSYEDTTNFTRYKVIGDEAAGEGALEPASYEGADALIVTRPDHALFLPLADCIGVVLYDRNNGILMMSHIGRHSAEQMGGQKSVEYMKQEFDSNPEDILVWLSPAVGKESYPLYKFNNRGLHEVVAAQMVEAGVARKNIEISHVDTAENDDYYSHSEFIAGNQPEDGRFAIVAMMAE